MLSLLTNTRLYVQQLINSLISPNVEHCWCLLTANLIFKTAGQAQQRM